MAVRRLAALRCVLYLALATCVQEPSGPPAPGPDAAGEAAASAAVLVGAGDIADCSRAWDSLTANLIDTIPGTVFALGDNAYPSGSSSDYANCYAPTWGRFKARTRPVPGNHDYSTAGAAGYFGYFGAAAGDPAKGYYSYDVGSWHIIALNSSVAHWVGSPQEQWLRADLAAHPVACTLAYWHYPLFSSSTVGGDPETQNFWQDLYDAGAELVLNGHHHDYERFAPQTPAGAVDPVYGIREIIVGTGGGEGLFPFGATAANSEVRNNETMGVLKLTLSDGGYTWKFIPVQGKTFTDAGRDDREYPADGERGREPDGQRRQPLHPQRHLQRSRRERLALVLRNRLGRRLAPNLGQHDQPVESASGHAHLRRGRHGHCPGDGDGQGWRVGYRQGRGDGDGEQTADGRVHGDLRGAELFVHRRQHRPGRAGRGLELELR